MSNANESTSSVKQAIAMLAGLRRRLVLRLVAVRSLWLALTLIAACFYFDAVMHLGGRARLVLDLGVAAAVLVVALATYGWLSRTVARDKMLARLVEREHPEVGNDLVNAVDFEARLDDGAAGHASPALMRQGIERAARSFEQLEGLESLRPAKIGRAHV